MSGKIFLKSRTGHFVYKDTPKSEEATLGQTLELVPDGDWRYIKTASTRSIIFAPVIVLNADLTIETELSITSRHLQQLLYSFWNTHDINHLATYRVTTRQHTWFWFTVNGFKVEDLKGIT